MSLNLYLAFVAACIALALLPGPMVTLVIANASKPHAVSACRGRGQRLSVSGFLGYSGPNAPLRAFS